MSGDVKQGGGKQYCSGCEIQRVLLIVHEVHTYVCVLFFVVWFEWSWWW